VPKPKKKAKSRESPAETTGQGVRPIWSGTITFGLVSIPVDLLSAVRPRQTAMKLIDKEGHALGRQYHCSKDGKKLDNNELVRGYETEEGKMVVITDEEFASVAPEMSADIRLRNFVPIDQIPCVYFQKSYFLSPSGKSTTAYNLLAATMKRTARAGIGSFVMRGHEYLVAIVSDNGVLRADTLRYADEIRSPGDIGLPARLKPSSTLMNEFINEIEELTRDELSTAEMEDTESEEIQALVAAKRKDSGNIVHQPGLETDEAEAPEQSAQIIDLTELLRRSLSKRVVVTNAQGNAPISLDERRALKRTAVGKATAKKASNRKSNGS
jgi:DNA end-binding protein Ku